MRKGLPNIVKIKIITGILVLAAIALISGATLLAVAAPGSQDDPFVTLDYLMNSFKPQIMADVNSAAQELSRAADSRIAEFETRLQANQGGMGTTAGGTDVFSVVTLSSSQSLVCSAGAEIMLRVGTATGFGTAPALVNYTSGDTLADGASLTVNNMYLVTIDGNGVRATADQVRILVRGNYTVSG